MALSTPDGPSIFAIDIRRNAVFLVGIHRHPSIIYRIFFSAIPAQPPIPAFTATLEKFCHTLPTVRAFVLGDLQVFTNFIILPLCDDEHVVLVRRVKEVHNVAQQVALQVG